MKPYLAAPFLLALLACAPPLQRCIHQAAPDLPVLNRLIAETQGNLKRGYAYADVVVERPIWVDCSNWRAKSGHDGGSGRCMGLAPTMMRKPVAVDLTAEAAKLASMQTRRAALEAQAQPAIAQCQAQFSK